MRSIWTVCSKCGKHSDEVCCVGSINIPLKDYVIRHKEYTAVRKTLWRKRKGKSYASVRNEKTKKYQQTLYGKLSLKAGSINTQAGNRKAVGRISGNDILELWIKQNNVNCEQCICAICKENTNNWCFDHIIPICNGGKNNIENIQILCENCHKIKTTKDVQGYNEINSEYII